jgi:hypothetical protein
VVSKTIVAERSSNNASIRAVFGVRPSASRTMRRIASSSRSLGVDDLEVAHGGDGRRARGAAHFTSHRDQVLDKVTAGLLVARNIEV